VPPRLAVVVPGYANGLIHCVAPTELVLARYRDARK